MIVYVLGLALQRGQEIIQRISHSPEKKKTNNLNLFQTITRNKLSERPQNLKSAWIQNVIIIS